MVAALTRQTIMLKDGRMLGFAEWGKLDGKPVFLFGGSSSARLTRYPDESLLVEQNVHLVTFDRPGMGLSTRQRGRSLLDWVQDIREFAAQKQLSRFSVVAASQGGPYGAVCAYALPDLLSSVTLVSAVSPLNDPAVMNTQRAPIKFNIFLARHALWLYTLQLNAMRPMLKGSRPQKLLQMIFKNLPESDREVFKNPDVPAMMIEDMRESMRQGGAGAADDMRACVVDWGFRLEDIRAKVFLWQGKLDPNVTPAMGHYIAERIPDCEATFVPDAGHFLMFTHWREIIDQLMTAWQA